VSSIGVASHDHGITNFETHADCVQAAHALKPGIAWNCYETQRQAERCGPYQLIAPEFPEPRTVKRL
jgi:hypothetical protein